MQVIYFRWVSQRERSSFCQHLSSLGNKWLLRIPHRFQHNELNYFGILGNSHFFFPVIFRILSNNKISELKNGSFSGLSLLERLWVFFIIISYCYFTECIFIVNLLLSPQLFQTKIEFFQDLIMKNFKNWILENNWLKQRWTEFL